MFLPDYLLDVERCPARAARRRGGVCVECCGQDRARTLAPDRSLDVADARRVCRAGVSSIYLHAIPLFGRLIHPWMPFLRVMLADALTYAPEGQRRNAYAGVFAAAIISWAMAAWTYVPLKYPPDVLYGLGIDTTKVAAASKLCELCPGTDYASPVRSIGRRMPVLERRQLRPC